MDQRPAWGTVVLSGLIAWAATTFPAIWTRIARILLWRRAEQARQPSLPTG